MTFAEAVSKTVTGIAKAARAAWPETDWVALSPIPPDSDPRTVYVQIDRAERQPMTVRRREVALRIRVGRVWDDSGLIEDRFNHSVAAASALIAEVESSDECGRAPIVSEVDWDIDDAGSPILVCTIETTAEEGEP